jgi:hypothetical protein
MQCAALLDWCSWQGQLPVSTCTAAPDGPSFQDVRCVSLCGSQCLTLQLCPC